MNDAVQLLKEILDAETAYQLQHGHAPRLLKLPLIQALTLAKFKDSHTGELSVEIMKKGIKAFEEKSLFGVKVKLARGQQQFSFE